MRTLFRAVSMALLLGLGAYLPAAAQRADTVRVGEQKESAPGVTDSAAPAVNGVVTADSAAVDSAADPGQAGNKEKATAHVDPPVLRTIADSAVNDWQNDNAYAYANDPAYWRPQELRTARPNVWFFRFLDSKWTGYVMLFLLGAVLLYAIVRIVADNNLHFFYRSPKRQTPVKSAGDASPLKDDLEGQLQHYLQIRDYRQAVRYLYLKTLRILDDRGLIRYHKDATNREYWGQLSQTPQGVPFRDLTLIYEKVWYGEFPLADPLFNRLHAYFEDFYKTVGA